MGVTKQAVDAARRRAGMPRRPRVCTSRCWLPERIAKFSEAWVDPDLTVYQISKRFGLQPASASNRAALLNLPRRAGRWSPQEDARLRQLWADRTLVIEEIAKILGRTRASVANHVLALRLPKRKHHLDYIRWTAEREERLRQLWFSDLSCQQIALQLGCTKAALITHRTKTNLPPRPSGRHQNRISVAAWDLMTEEERNALPQWRKPVTSRHQVKRRPARRRKSKLFGPGKIAA
jgi:hypothetical protein